MIPLLFISFQKYGPKLISNRQVMLFFLAAVALTIFYHSYMHYFADIKMESTLIQFNLAGTFQAWKTN